jgi:hypothetical protein
MKLKTTIVLASLLVVGLFSCTRNAGDIENLQPVKKISPSGQNIGLKSSSFANARTMKMTVKASNVPEEFVSAGGTLTKVELVAQGNLRKGKMGKRITIWNSVEYIDDLLDMNRGIMGDLFFLPIPTGVYTRAIVTITDGWVLKKDGTKYPLIFPGNKFILTFRPFVKVGEHLSPDVILSIDVSRSLVPVHHGTFYIFRPLVRAQNLSYTGSLAGGVVDGTTGAPIGNATVYIKINGEKYSTLSLDHYYVDTIPLDATTDTTVEHFPGEYWLPGIPAGSYTAYAEKEGYQKDSVEVNILEGNFTFHNFALMPQ